MWVLIILAILIGVVVFDVGYRVGRHRASRDTEGWKQQAITMRELWIAEQDFFKQAMELAGKYKTNSADLRRIFIERLSPDERAEVERLMQVQELEWMFKR